MRTPSAAGSPFATGEPVRLRVRNTVEGTVSEHEVGPRALRLGRDAVCEIRLPSRFVSGQAAVVGRVDGTLTLRRIGQSVVTINGIAAPAGRQIELSVGDTIELTGQFVVHVVDDANPAQPVPQVPWRDAARRLKSRLHREFVEREKRDPVGRWDEARARQEIRKLIEEALADPAAETRESVRALASEGVYTRVVVRATLGSDHLPPPPKDLRVPSLDAAIDAEVERILAAIRPQEKGAEARFDRRAAVRVETLILEGASRTDGVTVRYTAQCHLLREMDHLILGRGPLELLLGHRSVLEVMVVGCDDVYVETGAGLVRTGLYFPSTERLEHVVGKLLDPLGRRVNALTPLVDGRTDEGFRLNAVVAPVALTGPYLTVRRFPEKALTIKDLIDKGTLSDQAAQILCAFVRCRKNLVISGGTSSGKTTLLNALSAFIGIDERIVTVEDSHELRIQRPHVVGLESVPKTIEGQNEIPLRDLVINALRMRPDRIIVGECRGREAFDMVQAMSTGHDGSMTTLHANNAAEAVQRLESMILTAQDLPLVAVRRQIASAVHVIVQIGRDAAGRRRVRQVTEVLGVDPDTHEVDLRDLFRAEGVDGRLAATGNLPSFVGDLVTQGVLQIEHFFTE